MTGNTPEAADLLALVARLDRICLEIRAWAEASGSAGDRKRLVDLRRQLSEVVAETGRVGHALLASGSREQLAAFRQFFSALRSGVALHQAEWPAVRLGGEEDNAYRHSAQAAQEATADFIRWVRANVR